ncbi:DNA topoisomerase-3 [Kribbella aluminosa]|uniref:DNA topoisomerase-3 n=1 Tax=Kribbella aluminosa TaxID=416017 RepID=A0ABS4UBN7_9ACTN|nr:DNA topoisomerase [Kribbella aluminosa]MBP2349056.1 DNA topoisomerase-3 [Kribbella aluminosa]
MTVGILTEKPSAARHFAAALGGKSGSYNGERFVIAHARGHLYEFVDPHQMVSDPALAGRYHRWDLANLPWDPRDLTWDLEVIKGVAKVAQEVKQTLAGCDEIVIATDVDPTGEGGMIAVNAFLELGLRPKSWSRMYFTDEAPASLQKAFSSRKTIASLQHFDEYAKAIYRSKFDFLSMQWTRCATSIARSRGRDTVLRQGRLKSAMVKLVGDQLKAYSDYVKQPFFQNRFRDENDVMYTNPNEPRFGQKAQVPQRYAASPVVLDATVTKQTAPPRLLDLAALSSMLVGKGVKAKLVLETYQKMYEAQVVSYPRTEDKTITPEQFNELAPLADNIAAVAGVDIALLTHRKPRRTHVKPQGAHGANRPGPKVPASLDDVAQRFGQTGRLIYETLAKNYLAMLAEDYVYEQQKGHVRRYAEFVGIANVPKSAGWKAVFDPDSGDDPADNSATADPVATETSKGLGRNAEPFVFEGANKRPEHPSMKWLMKQLEKRDVGTGATRTSTYSEVTSTSVKYPLLVERSRKLTLADAGQLSWLLLPGTRIGSLDLTEKIYADMRDIAAGSATAEERLAVVADWVREDIAQMEKNAAAIEAKLGPQGTAVTHKERAAGTWAKTGQSVTFARAWGGHRFSDQEVQQLLAAETIEFQARSRQGKTYDVFGELAEQTFKGNKFVGFSKLGLGRRDASGAAQPPKEWCSHVFTPAELKQLAAGGSVESGDFLSKQGNAFQCKVWFKEDKPGEGKKIVPDFDTSLPPTSWCQHVFTDDERTALASGTSIHVKGLTSARGRKFDADLTWKNEDGRKKIVPAFA